MAEQSEDAASTERSTIDEEGPAPLAPARPRMLERLAMALERVHLLRARIEQTRVRSGPLDAALATIERDSEIGGPILAGAVAYRLFIFALPLAFFLASGLGLLADALEVDPQSAGKSVGLAGLITQQVASAAEGSSSFWVALTSFLVLAFVTRVLLLALAIVHALASERSAAAVSVSRHSFGVFSAATGRVMIGAAGLNATLYERRSRAARVTA